MRDVVSPGLDLLAAGIQLSKGYCPLHVVFRTILVYFYSHALEQEPSQQFFPPSMIERENRRTQCWEIGYCIQERAT